MRATAHIARNNLLGGATALAILCTACSDSRPAKGPYDTDPLEPAQALESFQIIEGFRLETVAAEPEVVDPVESAFDENGDLWVAEMLDYPFDPPEGKPARGRIRFLRDGDGDGRFETATVFADELLQVSSVLPWRGGVLVTAAPEILYLRDTNGDGKADLREVWFRGFASTGVSSEARVTNLRLGIDNWIYAANSGRAGKITSPKWPDQPPAWVGGGDFRFHPVRGLFEAAAGPTQFGMSFDAWGNRFVSQNTLHLRHAVFPTRYLAGKTLFRLPSMLEDVTAHDPASSVIYPLTEPQEWRKRRTEVRQRRYDATQPERVEQLEGHFSAATGATVYLGDAFPAAYAGSVFTADAAASLIHRDVLSPSGVTFRAERFPKGREFLASTDVWFRPVNFANGPDGNLYVVDFYREYIEEPASIPESIKKEVEIDFYRGNDRGRIYRIAAEGRSASPPKLPGDADAEALVAMLGHSNGWHRRTAQRLLVERADVSVVPTLEHTAANAGSPLARLHALWTLEGLDSLDKVLVRSALRDDNPHIREHALRLAEGFLPELGNAVTARLGETEPRLRFQLALTLGKINGNHRPLAKLASGGVEDRWMRAALLASAGPRSLQLLTRMLVRYRDFFNEPTSEKQEFIENLTSRIGAGRGANDVTMLLITLDGSPVIRREPWLETTLRGLAKGLARPSKKRLRVPSAEHVLGSLLRHRTEAVRTEAAEVCQYLVFPEFTSMALVSARDESLPIEKRARAVRYLRGGSFRAVAPTLRTILASPSPQAVKEAAVEAAAQFDDPAVGEMLTAGWPGFSPEIRARAMRTLLRRPERIGAWLAAAEAGSVDVASIDAVDRIRLREYPDPAVRDRATALLAVEKSIDAAVSETRGEVLGLDGRAAAGRPLFDEHCAACHEPQGGRGRIGPDLSGVNNKTREELLTEILQPSAKIAARFTNYIVVARDGFVYDGLLVRETAGEVTLRHEHEDVCVARDNIAEMRASAVSLMPDGWARDLTRQQLADVIAYLRAGL